MKAAYFVVVKIPVIWFEQWSDFFSKTQTATFVICYESEFLKKTRRLSSIRDAAYYQLLIQNSEKNH